MQNKKSNFFKNLRYFTFNIYHVNVENSEVHKIIYRDFGYTLINKKKAQHLEEHPEHKGFFLPSRIEEDLFENSWEAVEMNNEISSLLRMVLKEASKDFLERFSTSVGMVTESREPNNNYYIIELVDKKYPLRDASGYTVDKTISHTLSTHKFSASEFVDYNPNFTPDFWKVWKDFSDINSDHPNRKLKEDGLTKSSMNEGIRSKIKNIFNLDEFTNRFTNSPTNKSHFPENDFSMFSKQY